MQASQLFVYIYMVLHNEQAVVYTTHIYFLFTKGLDVYKYDSIIVTTKRERDFFPSSFPFPLRLSLFLSSPITNDSYSLSLSLSLSPCSSFSCSLSLSLSSCQNAIWMTGANAGQEKNAAAKKQNNTMRELRDFLAAILDDFPSFSSSPLGFWSVLLDCPAASEVASGFCCCAGSGEASTDFERAEIVAAATSVSQVAAHALEVRYGKGMTKGEKES